MKSTTSKVLAPTSAGSPVYSVLDTCRSSFLGVGLFSCFINVLALTGALFMMQIYDRVLASQSVPTLIVLSLIAALAYAFQGGLEMGRSRIMALAGERVDEVVGPKIYSALAALPLQRPQGRHETLQPFRDLDAIRNFLGGPGPLAAFDLPWLPFFLLVMYVIHPWLCLLTLAGAVMLGLLTALTELRSKTPSRAAVEAQSSRNSGAEAAQSGAEVVHAMGMLPALAGRWQADHDKFMKSHRATVFAVSGISTASRTLRLVLQSAMLGLAAYLAINGEVSAGSIVAASIISARALAPVDQAISAWRGFVAARDGHRRLCQLLGPAGESSAKFKLPPPGRMLAAENLTVAPPGSRQPIVHNVSFALSAGQTLGIIGASASGKTTLVRALVGAWAPLAGKVMLDGTSIDQWETHVLGPSIGYLPQDVQLFEGTIAENIARFQKNADPEAVIKAAKVSGFHEHIVKFPDGYNTRIGKGGAHLSAGQRQRVGLARALYGDPFLIVLDEPNANLDVEGDKAVTTAIRSIAARGGIAIIVAHRSTALQAIEQVLIMKQGECAGFGPRDAILSKFAQNTGNVVPHPGARTESIRIEGGL